MNKVAHEANPVITDHARKIRSRKGKRYKKENRKSTHLTRMSIGINNQISQREILAENYSEEKENINIKDF